jgi:alpha-glucuronidase
VIRRLLFLLATLFLSGLAPARPCLAEDGYQLWLRYPPMPSQQRERARDRFGSILVPASRSPSAQAALEELQRGLSGLLGQPVPLTDQPRYGAILLGTPDTVPLISQLDLPLGRIGAEGYLIRSVEIGSHATTVIAGNSDTALIYGVFTLLRLLRTDASPDTLDVLDEPAVQLRVLNHWDNLDRSVERGYAGQSIWDWWRLPDFRDPRYTDYARANASIGINGTVLNNVNAQAEVLTAPYLAKAAALADLFRPWGIRVYLSVRFSAPVDIGGLTTADPLDPAVRAWWRAKADEIYALIPDFGGFLVKANSEGQPGPQNYGRSHADGANMLAGTLRPHGGNVMWRAFVYSQDDPEDRVRQAYAEFKPLDGTFADNVLVQVKNGPLDFQPREPFHPLFGAMPGSPLMMEFQITQEYLGFSTHLVYLGALYEEVLAADTFAAGAGSTVARVIDGSLHGYSRTGMAGVANIGSDRDWSGSTFAQANWYAFGRLAWNPLGSARAIAEEWLRMTFSNDPRFVEPAAELMMRSRQAVVDYMTPLGLAHLMGTGHHYGPAPWVDDLERPEWNPFYYHRADAQGIGFDRSERGSDAVAQYAPPVARRFADLQSVPDDFLLWFHRLPWDHRLRSGATLWEELVARYDRGIAEVEAMRAAWSDLQPFVDAERFAKTLDFLDIQLREARWWRDACLAYFMHQSGRELPPGTRPPAESLEHYRSLEFPYPPGW